MRGPGGGKTEPHLIITRNAHGAEEGEGLGTRLVARPWRLRGIVFPCINTQMVLKPLRSPSRRCILCVYTRKPQVAVHGITIKSSVYTSVCTQKPQISKIKFCVSWYGAVGASENHFKSTHVATPQLAGHVMTGTAIARHSSTQLDVTAPVRLPQLPAPL